MQVFIQAIEGEDKWNQKWRPGQHNRIMWDGEQYEGKENEQRGYKKTEEIDKFTDTNSKATNEKRRYFIWSEITVGVRSMAKLTNGKAISTHTNGEKTRRNTVLKAATKQENKHQQKSCRKRNKWKKAPSAQMGNRSEQRWGDRSRSVIVMRFQADGKSHREKTLPLQDSLFG